MEWRRSSVLEVAAGVGGGLLYLQTRYRPNEVIGVDTSIVAVRRGRRLGIDSRRGNATTLAFEDRRFDCVVCVDALGYLPEAEFAREVSRVVRSGGLLLLGASAVSFWRQRINFGGWQVSAGSKLSVAGISPGACASPLRKEIAVVRLAWHGSRPQSGTA